MASKGFRWSWPQSKPGGKRKPTTVDIDKLYSDVADEPWEAVQGGQRGMASASVAREGMRGQQPPRAADNRPAWLSELESPYGLADEDGTLKELDSVNWRRVPRLKRRSSRGFVPRTSNRNESPGQVPPSGRWQNDARNGPGTGGQSPNTPRAGSTWMLQLGGAAVLTLVAIYAHNSSTPLGTEVRGVYQRAFSDDYTQMAVPVISHFLQSHNIAVPTFLTQSGALSLHVPLQGTIVQDYSKTNPQMTIAGKPDENVLAAGSGTVTRVVSLQSGTMVVIDHGTIGSSYYFGLKQASVKVGESVASGQVIGHLPSTNPKLMFELEQSGHAVNPHDYIVFPGNAT